MPTDTPRPGLTRDRIVAAAIRRADRERMERLSMRALAGDLGVEAMSLYNHVRNKEDLIDGMIEAVLGDVARPRAGHDWQGEMRARAQTMRAVFTAHPWAPPLVSGRINLGTTTLAMIDAILGCLRAAGFSYVQADHIWNALDSVTFGFHLLERTFPLKPDQYAEAARHFLPLIDPVALPHMHALSTMVADGRHDGLNDFGFVLDRMLQALDALPRLG